MIFTILVLIVVTIICAIVVNHYKKFSYWKNKNVAGPKPQPLTGNFGGVMFMQESVTTLCSKVYSQYSKEKVVGLYQGTTPMLLVREPDLIKDVLMKDFAYFSDRGTQVSNDVLANNLINAEVDFWRKLRHSFTPMFSSGKLKSMSPLIHNCVEEFQNHVDTILIDSEQQEIRTLMAKYTLEVIGSCAFGLKIGALTKEGNIFSEIAERLFKPSLRSAILRGIDMIIPGFLKFFNISVTSNKLTHFFQNLVRQVVEEREGKSTGRKDFMDLLIELKDREKLKANFDTAEHDLALDITNDVMAAQALVFYAAGFETSSAAMSFLLYELALNPKCQEKIYEEICTVFKKHGEISYDAVCELDYLEMAFDEILRKYPPGTILFRQCVNDYTFSGLKLKINKGVRVLIPVYGLHQDPKYFEDPQKFKPERFSLENKRNIYPCSYIPFGEGPRYCIGMRFAKIQSMMGLAGFLHKYKVETSNKTKVPLEFEIRSITMKSKDGIWLNIRKRSK